MTDFDDDPFASPVVIRRARTGRFRPSWNRTPPGGPALGDSVQFERLGDPTWGLLQDRLADGTLVLHGGSKIAPDAVLAFEPGPARSGFQPDPEEEPDGPET